MAQPTATNRTTAAGPRLTPIRAAAGIVGAVFLLVGVLGFIPGITTNVGDMELVGHETSTKLLGIFGVNVVHNLVHLAFGAIGLFAARSSILSRNFLTIGGVIYLALWLYGLVIDLDSSWNFVSLNTADNWLHFALGAGMVLAGFLVPDRRTAV